ncbi:ATP synthase subunit H [Plasmodiophora brassicae]
MVPNAIFYGTQMFVVLGIVTCMISGGLRVAGKHSQFGLSVTLITTATFCMWLMWVLTWLMQWHPLIVPEKPVKQH